MNELDRKHLACIAACISAKSELRSQNFLNESSTNVMLSHEMKDCVYFVNVAGERIACKLSMDKEHLVVYWDEIYNIFFFKELTFGFEF